MLQIWVRNIRRKSAGLQLLRDKKQNKLHPWRLNPWGRRKLIWAWITLLSVDSTMFSGLNSGTMCGFMLFIPMCNLSLHFKSSGEWQIVFVGDNVELIKTRKIDHVSMCFSQWCCHFLCWGRESFHSFTDRSGHNLHPHCASSKRVSTRINLQMYTNYKLLSNFTQIPTLILLSDTAKVNISTAQRTNQILWYHSGYVRLEQPISETQIMLHTELLLRNGLTLTETCWGTNIPHSMCFVAVFCPMTAVTGVAVHPLWIRTGGRSQFPSLFTISVSHTEFDLKKDPVQHWSLSLRLRTPEWQASVTFQGIS